MIIKNNNKQITGKKILSASFKYTLQQNAINFKSLGNIFAFLKNLKYAAGTQPPQIS